ncbi:hypothetical protein ACTI_69100 [Actinoplanes sp. OR16]|uniref:hypothetical protein n=1 Tax=Actinoplanes sp. OR16 TaxID=946334 RepID=UPI000F6DAD1A|nr:hypothetical protein [Actinoplanes sp. OR16]BBH70225.1 hypothetical protein ACTI_69100 [Actinoplanes sp. OR16]
MTTDSDYLGQVRRAGSYPQALRAGRLYFGGLLWMMGSAFVVSCAGWGLPFFWLSAAAIPFIVVGVLAARKAWSRLERELPGMPQREVRSASILATLQDLLRRR